MFFLTRKFSILGEENAAASSSQLQYPTTNHIVLGEWSDVRSMLATDVKTAMVVNCECAGPIADMAIVWQISGTHPNVHIAENFAELGFLLLKAKKLVNSSNPCYPARFV
jgi:hypothetical protein